ncbi:type II toxin-antitoxin system RelE/ParE family toxin [Massilia sp. Root351]|uniref:type II toxin-antitoxin system RelE/ParE family toxin n=1 Tax=Massilia sp. Root351 TaxID=1736522 RepID=UPI0035A37EA2
MPSKPKIVWAPAAKADYDAALRRIGTTDPRAADLVARRVRRLLALLEIQPMLGTPATTLNIRRFAIPKTGHTIEYRVRPGELHILRWYRQRRKRP